MRSCDLLCISAQSVLSICCGHGCWSVSTSVLVLGRTILRKDRRGNEK